MTSLFKTHIAFILIYTFWPTENTAMALENHWPRLSVLPNETIVLKAKPGKNLFLSCFVEPSKAKILADLIAILSFRSWPLFAVFPDLSHTL